MRASLRPIVPALLGGSLWICSPANAGEAKSPTRESPAPKTEQAGDTEQPHAVDTTDTPPPAPAPEFQVPSPAEGVSAEGEEEGRPKDLFYGAGVRTRWVTVPSWLLGAFTVHNMPLSSYHAGVEAFRRKGNKDIVLGFSYQNMSPPDGNWLGSGRKPADDTYFVQFKGLGLIGLDLNFVWHKNFTDVFGIHFGGGVGAAVVTGEVLRTSNAGCTDSTAGDVALCHPLGVTCTDKGCDETQLKQTEAKGGRAVDAPTSPSRFKEQDIPPFMLIVEAMGGLDFHIPPVPGLEIRIEGGIFDAFFAGGAIAYAF